MFGDNLQRTDVQGVDMQPSAATSLRDAVLAGMWDEALQLLPELSAGEVNLKQAQFLVLRQKYLECIKGGDTEAALSCLRFELQPLEVNQKVLHGLTGEKPTFEVFLASKQTILRDNMGKFLVCLVLHKPTNTYTKTTNQNRYTELLVIMIDVARTELKGI